MNLNYFIFTLFIITNHSLFGVNNFQRLIKKSSQEEFKQPTFQSLEQEVRRLEELPVFQAIKIDQTPNGTTNISGFKYPEDLDQYFKVAEMENPDDELNIEEIKFADNEELLLQAVAEINQYINNLSTIQNDLELINQNNRGNEFIELNTRINDIRTKAETLLQLILPDVPEEYRNL